MRILRQTTLAAALLLAVLVPAAAQADVCVDLEAQLIQIDRSAQGTGNNARQFDTPIAQQKNEIARATAEARRAGCMGGFLFFQPKPEAKCGKLMATIDKMQNNLQRLMSERGQYDNDPFALSQRRSQVLRALAQNRCGATYASNDGGLFGDQSSGGGGLFSTLFGPRIQTFGDGDFSSRTGIGTYRTMCVRTCDGFYFPISFSTVPSQFAADSASCQAMCPGTETLLYTYRNPGEDTDQMVSLAGEPYTSLPSAFKFRTSYDKSCTCGSVSASLGGFTEFQTGGTIDPLATAAATVPPSPNLRPPRGEDPETIANRAGDFTPRPVVPAPDGETATATADGKKVRIVGPAYYYGQ
jgi:hypothetical protein